MRSFRGVLLEDIKGGPARGKIVDVLKWTDGNFVIPHHTGWWLVDPSFVQLIDKKLEASLIRA